MRIEGILAPELYQALLKYVMFPTLKLYPALPKDVLPPAPFSKLALDTQNFRSTEIASYM